MQIFTYSGSKLAHASSIADLELSVEAGDPVFSFFENCVHKKFSKLQYLRVYVRSRTSEQGAGHRFSTEYVERRDMMMDLVESLLTRKCSDVEEGKDHNFSCTVYTFQSAEKGCTLT